MIGGDRTRGCRRRSIQGSPPLPSLLPSPLAPPSQARLRMKHAEIMVRGGPSEACPLIGSRRGPLHQGQALRLLDRACLRDLQAQMKEQLWGEGEEGEARPTYGEEGGLWGGGEGEREVRPTYGEGG